MPQAGHAGLAALAAVGGETGATAPRRPWLDARSRGRAGRHRRSSGQFTEPLLATVVQPGGPPHPSPQRSDCALTHHLSAGQSGNLNSLHIGHFVLHEPSLEKRDPRPLRQSWHIERRWTVSNCRLHLFLMIGSPSNLHEALRRPVENGYVDRTSTRLRNLAPPRDRTRLLLRSPDRHAGGGCGRPPRVPSSGPRPYQPPRRRLILPTGSRLADSSHAPGLV